MQCIRCMHVLKQLLVLHDVIHLIVHLTMTTVVIVFCVNSCMGFFCMVEVVDGINEYKEHSLSYFAVLVMQAGHRTSV